jgi:phosphoglycerol transferase
VKRLLTYSLVGLASLLILTAVLQLWRGDLSIPLGATSSSNSDVVFTSMMVKTLIDHGWYLQNPDLGAPFAQNMQDFPLVDSALMLIIKLLAVVFPSYGAAINSFFILTFPLSALSAFFVLRYYKVSTLSAAVCGLLYAFLPYHFLRSVAHLMLSAYFMVPIAVLLAVEMWSKTPPFFEQGALRWSLRSALLLLACVLIGSTGVYYAFFACFFIAIAALSSYVSRHEFKALASGALVVGLIAGTVALNIAPSILYNAQHGRNAEVAVRGASEAEYFAMKMTQLVLPVGGHRLPLFQQISQKYAGFPLPNEGSATLGIVGSIGFLSLLVMLLRTGRLFESLGQRLALLNLGGILLGTVGGLGVLFAIFVSPSIRAYNRISVFIAFFALFQAALMIDWLRNRYAAQGWKLAAARLGLLVLLAVGILDQTTPFFVPPHDQSRELFAHNRRYIQSIEASLPKGSMIFQLPYVPFPENPPVHGMLDYDHFQAYLHSKDLKWSYGGLKGRPGDLWQRNLVTKPIDEVLETLAIAGFNGLYIDRYGYPDRAEDLEAKLQKLLGVPPLVSPNERLSFFDLQEYRTRLQAGFSSEELRRLSDKAFPVSLRFAKGFYPPEEGSWGPLPQNQWRWCLNHGELILENPREARREATLEMVVEAAVQEPAKLHIKGAGRDETVALGSGPVRIALPLSLPPGKSVIDLKTDARLILPPNDARQISFRVINATLDMKDKS